MNIKIYSWSQKIDLFFFCAYFLKIISIRLLIHDQLLIFVKPRWWAFHWNTFMVTWMLRCAFFYVPLFYFLARHVHRSIVHVNYVLFWYEQFVYDFYEFSRNARFYVYHVPISYTPIWCTVLLCVHTKILLTWTFHTNLSKRFWHGARYCNRLDMQGTVTFLSWMLL